MNANATYAPLESASAPARTGRLVWIAEHKGFLLTCAAILVLGFVVRLATLERFLPYVDHSAEIVHLNLAQRDVRHLPDAPYMLDMYADPTLYGYFNGAVQELVDALSTRSWHVAADYLYPLRFANLIVGLVTTVLMIVMGWQLAGPIAALFAGAIWAVSPVIVENNNPALPDAFVFLFTALAFYTAIQAWRSNSPWWLLGSLISGILVIYSKYWLATAVIPFLLVGALLTLRQPRKMLPWLILYTLIAGISAWYLLGMVNPLDLSGESPEITRFQSNVVEFALSPDRNFNNMWWAIYPIGHLVFYVTMIGGVIAYVYQARRNKRIIHLGEIALLAVFVISTNIMASSWTNVYILKIRHTIPETIALILIWAAALTQITWVLTDWVRERHLSAKGLYRFVPYGAAALALLAIAPVYLVDTVRAIQYYERLDITEVLWRYTDANIPTDGLILTHYKSGTEKTWNRAWSGYDGVKTFEWWFEPAETIVNTDPADFVERGILYFSMSDADRRIVYQKNDIDSFLNQLTLIKHIPASPDTVGEGVWFYRIIPPQVTADADFGGQIRLVGYDMNADDLNPGDTLTLRPYWRADKRPDSNYSMFIHLYPQDEEKILAQFDGAPTTPARPTLTWDDPDELFIGADVSLPLPPDLAPGDYRLVIGLYDYNTGARLSGPDGATYFTIPVTV